MYYSLLILKLFSPPSVFVHVQLYYMLYLYYLRRKDSETYSPSSSEFLNERTLRGSRCPSNTLHYDLCSNPEQVSAHSATDARIVPGYLSNTCGK